MIDVPSSFLALVLTILLGRTSGGLYSESNNWIGILRSSIGTSNAAWLCACAFGWPCWLANNLIIIYVNIGAAASGQPEHILFVIYKNKYNLETAAATTTTTASVTKTNNEKKDINNNNT